MPGKQTMTWNGETDAKLLLAILKTNDVKPDFEAVAAELSTDEIVCTPRAVQEHLKKLRKAALGGADSTTRAESSTASPAKPSVKETVFAARVKKSTRKTATGGKGKGKAAANADDAENVSSMTNPQFNRTVDPDEKFSDGEPRYRLWDHEYYRPADEYIQWALGDVTESVALPDEAQPFVYPFLDEMAYVAPA